MEIVAAYIVNQKNTVMKATFAQIEKALDNTFEAGKDGTQELYAAIRSVADEAERRAAIPKTQEYYTAADRKKIAREIQRLMA